MAEVARLDFASIERPFITVNIDGDEHKIPLTFNAADLKLFGEDAEGGFDAFMRKYLGDEVMDAIGDDLLRAIMSAWGQYRKELGEPDMGESSALPA